MLLNGKSQGNQNAKKDIDAWSNIWKVNVVNQEIALDTISNFTKTSFSCQNDLRANVSDYLPYFID